MTPHGGQNHEIHDFRGVMALKTRLSSPGALRCRAMFKIIIMTRRAFCSVRVIRLQRAASLHVQINLGFYYMEGGFSQISRDPQIHF